jgi:hypothetical protein
MREAVARAQDDGLTVIYTLHDALTIEAKDGDRRAIDTLVRAMDGAFRSIWPKKLHDRATCRLDAQAWGPGLEAGRFTTETGVPVETSKLYLDSKGEKEYFKYMGLVNSQS